MAAGPLKRRAKRTRSGPEQNEGSTQSSCAKSVAKSGPLTAGRDKLNPAMKVSWPRLASRIVGKALSTECLGNFLWVRHVLGLDEAVEFFGRDVAEFDGGFAQADVLPVRGFGDFGCLVVADLGRERGNEH